MLELPEKTSQLFRYFDGASECYGDPVVIENRFLDELEGNDPAVIDAQIQGSDAAVRRAAARLLSDTTRVAFELVPFDKATGLGMTEGQTITLWNRYMAWKNEVFQAPPEEATSAEVATSPPEGEPAPDPTPPPVG